MSVRRTHAGMRSPVTRKAPPADRKADSQDAGLDQESFYQPTSIRARLRWRRAFLASNLVQTTCHERADFSGAYVDAPAALPEESWVALELNERCAKTVNFPCETEGSDRNGPHVGFSRRLFATRL